jgi:hypothetical protein
VGGHLGVGVGGEPGVAELGPQRLVVLDDAVVDDRDPTGRVHVRVGVAVGRLAVGRPAGVPDAGPGRQRLGLERVDELLELAGPLHHAQVTPVVGDDAGGVVAPVLEARESGHDAVDGVGPAGDADDAAHG